MDCRTFHQQHVAFVDDTLPAVDMVAMQRHLLECAACATRDTAVRRSLLLFRNQPEIEPSPDFQQRLNARLRMLGPIDHRSRLELGGRGNFWRPPGWGGFVSAATGVLAAGYLAVAVLEWMPGEPESPLTLAPVVASIPEMPDTPIASPAIMASVSAGMPVWPAVLMAEQAPMHFAGSEFQLVSWGR